ncbi:hypothetical protein DdX_00633 [Ditylenchus destructor]|uniref:Uncharacterized protein n=1 Tax=Ditylenchus destructor TaxID=166010 RepID=A0AAD4RDE1_9BILA|nr:hypothetical protein DdX_00633 [Ditylenchus destructor]
MVFDAHQSRVSQHDDPEEGETENNSYTDNSLPVCPLPPQGIFSLSAVPTTFGYSPRSSFRMPSDSPPPTKNTPKSIAAFIGDSCNATGGKVGTVKANPHKQIDFHSAFVSQKHTAPAPHKDKKVR